jgi:hypothetical protein
MPMAVVLIRRFVRADKEREFLIKFKAAKPLNNSKFKGETLLRVIPNHACRAPGDVPRARIFAPS